MANNIDKHNKKTTATNLLSLLPQLKHAARSEKKIKRPKKELRFLPTSLALAPSGGVHHPTGGSAKHARRYNRRSTSSKDVSFFVIRHRTNLTKKVTPCPLSPSIRTCRTYVPRAHRLACAACPIQSPRYSHHSTRGFCLLVSFLVVFPVPFFCVHFFFLFLPCLW